MNRVPGLRWVIAISGLLLAWREGRQRGAKVANSDVASSSSAIGR